MQQKIQKSKMNGRLPGERGCLIQAACYDSSGGDDVEDREDPDLDHQLLQLVDLGATLLLLDHAPGQAWLSQGDLWGEKGGNLILKSEMNPAERKETPRMR